jgi:ABC-type antimicrobial peptide transport system permease subunit
VREIGFRVALGAAPSRVLRRVFSEGAWLVGVGLAIGLAASYFVTTPLAQFLVEGVSTDLPCRLRPDDRSRLGGLRHTRSPRAAD